MVKINSTSRLFSIDTQVILAQTDTTVGFLSQDAQKLYEVKSRDTSKPFIKVYQRFKDLQSHKLRIPSSFKSRVRRSTKTTFIVKDSAFRVVASHLNSSILRNLRWNHSTSANESGKSFQRDFCEQKADIIIEDKNSFKESSSSSLFKINKKKIKRLR